MINFYFIIELPVSLSPRQGRIIIIIALCYAYYSLQREKKRKYSSRSLRASIDGIDFNSLFELLFDH